MIQKYLNKLEYNLIIENLIKNCKTFIGKEIASKLEPSSNVKKVSRTLEETSEAVNLFSKYGSFPISEIDVKRIKRLSQRCSGVFTIFR